MSHDPFDDLRGAIARRDAVLVIGAGVSIGASDGAPCASWRGLLRDGVARCEALDPALRQGWARRAREEIDSGDPDELLSAAEMGTRKLGGPNGGEFARWLNESVGALRAARRDTVEALAALRVPLATTNYDDILEEVTGLPPATWDEGARVERVLRGDEQGILHLHGHWRRPPSVVLGIRSYEAVLGDAHAQAVLRALQTLRTLVFVGFGGGLADPNFGALMAWTAKVFGGSIYRRYRLVTEAERVAVQAEHPAEQRVLVLSSGETHDDLAGYLHRLRPASAPAAPPVAAVPPGAWSLPAAPLCVGRDDELRELIARLLAAEPPPVPILGPPGVGKSTLALAALHDPPVAERYGARRFFARCDGAASRRALAESIGATIGVRPSDAVERAALAELARAPAVLVLDNAETPWHADTQPVEELFGVLAAAPEVVLVVTIRGGERPGGVRWAEPFRPAPLPLLEARAVFLAVAGREFEHDARLDDLIAALDGVPLAITLMAHQAQGEPDLAGLWHRWQDERTRMLQRAAGDHRLTNIELSYELSIRGPRMSDNGRRLLQLLALLPAGLDLGALPDLLPGAGLAATALLRKTGLAFDERGRIRALAPLREFVKRSHPPPAADLARCTASFVDLIRSNGGAVGTSRGAEAVAILVREAPNVEPILELALKGGDPGAAVRAALEWGQFVRFTGWGTAAIVERAAEVAVQTGDEQLVAACVRAWVTSRSRARSTTPPARASTMRSGCTREFRSRTRRAGRTFVSPGSMAMNRPGSSTYRPRGICGRASDERTSSRC